MTQQVKTLCSYLLNSHQLCQKNTKLSYLKAFFIQKAIIFTKKLKTYMQNAVFTLNAYDHLFLISVNGKNDVIKGPVLPSVIEIGKPNLFRQDFLAKPYFESKQLLVLLSKRHFSGKILEVYAFKMLHVKI